MMERRRLQQAHRRLDQEIMQAMESAWFDPMTLQELKKKKLALKDRLNRIAPLAKHDDLDGSVKAA